jgi:acetyltransferase-like isoleucine patch superfamily enzyme
VESDHEVSMTEEERKIMAVCYAPHHDIHSGEITIDKGALLSPLCRIDLTGSVFIGEMSMIGEGTQILTHDHYHEGREPLLLLQQRKGVKWQDKKIGKDVWLHGCIVLYQVTNIPDGVVVGAGSVLTKNPGPYEIWAGNPSIPIDVRSKYPAKEFKEKIDQLDAGFICGFVDGEGSFSVTENKSSNGTHYPQFRFSVESDARDARIYELMDDVLNGRITTRKRGERPRMETFTIGDIKGLTERVVPFFDTYPLKGLKMVKYKRWREDLLDYFAKQYGEKGGQIE